MTLPIFNGQIPDSIDLNKNLIHEVAEQLQLTVSGSETSVSFTNPKVEVLVKNVGSVSAYINFDAPASTTDSFELISGKERKFHGEISSVHAITGGSTTDLRIWGFGDS